MAHDIVFLACNTCFDHIVGYPMPCVLVLYTYGFFFSLCTHSYAFQWFDCYLTSISIFESLLETFQEFWIHSVTLAAP